MYAYCQENDILIKAPSLKRAREYGAYKLSEAYGHKPGRADSLNLKCISAAQAEELDGSSITWETE